MIVFKKLRFKNILSYGNVFTEMDFLKSPMTLIQGKNGNGKSVFLDAFVFSVFGVPYRNINKPNLVNSINGKDMVTEIEFEIGTNSYMVRRGIKPTIFEIFINGKLLDQASTSKDYQKHLEENILRITYKAFTQLVILGTANFVPFMQLSAADRREVIEELLDIRVFSRMNIVLKERISQNKENIKSLDAKTQNIKEKIDIQKDHIKKFQQKTQEYIDSNLKEIEKTNVVIQTIEKEIENLNSEIAVKLASASDGSSLSSKLDKFTDIRRKLAAQIGKFEKAISFYEKNNDCPTCFQRIDEEFRKKTIEEKKTKNSEAADGMKELDVKIEDLQESVNKIQQVNKEIHLLNLNIQSKNSTISGHRRFIEKIEKDIQKYNQSNTIDSESVTKLADYEKSQQEYVTQRNTSIDDAHYYEMAQFLLKDTGIKTKIIRQYLPLMNKYINKYLSAMDFFVNFNLDENFKEVIKSRHRDEFEYNSFSEGEKFRIDMALLLTWREISRKKNSTNTNIMFLDEVFDSSLDASGTEEFMKLLKTLSQKINIFVISHKPDVLNDKFSTILKVEKKKNFSVLS